MADRENETVLAPARQLDAPALDEDIDEPTKEQLLEELAISWKQALSGETMPARQVLREVRRELEQETDAQAG
ncbi:MAG: hypothetical protein OXE46_02790 [Chloroflexi bacterium]|nr:hypothetical protein [Chloroflexota bacterium]